MKKRHLLMVFLTFVFIGFPLYLHISWTYSNPVSLNIVSVNKSVLTFENFGNLAYNWVFRHKKISYKDGNQFIAEKSHVGFIPLENKKYRTTDLSLANTSEPESLLQDADLIYFADSHGVYSDDWYGKEADSLPFHKIYGGLDQADLEYISNMLKKKKTVIAEFNFFAPPTPEHIREQAQDLLDLRWQGWTGRYFSSLNPENNDMLPPWLVKLYEEQNKGRWNYKGEGIGLVDEYNKVVVLEYPAHLKEPAPVIITQKQQRLEYNIPEKVSFPAWFEITQSTSDNNQVVSWFELAVTKEGKKILEENNIPLKFPAVLHNNVKGEFFYFTGEFGKNQVPDRFLKLKGAQYLEYMFTDLRDHSSRNGFFFTYYLPLTSGIYQKISLKNHKME